MSLPTLQLTSSNSKVHLALTTGSKNTYSQLVQTCLCRRNCYRNYRYFRTLVANSPAEAAIDRTRKPRLGPEFRRVRSGSRSGCCWRRTFHFLDSFLIFLDPINSSPMKIFQSKIGLNIIYAETPNVDKKAPT